MPNPKGVSLGLFQPTPKEVKEQRRKMRKEELVTIDLLLRAVPQPNILTKGCGPSAEKASFVWRQLFFPLSDN
jgi:hypothetical protein